ncbi:uncharacterized protein RHIMIDRAFT_241223 [Rhizopus microsporus ATCC 52813]|uniref:Uncharacterized protein n=1 Tax=Rhizopus microsporus ATCC 52813 TaxID=1340429 RepID=A0A2G4SJR6_RHIZD|nr:uncharacterized protein RHIMIDRAFT_241223 [Rhizopus microsporus ATCC 52813]PHZ09018.1 hypothetical protein RHIMIDRAFT_241223 [Rhizopus microsporus ATCC 52813]
MNDGLILPTSSSPTTSEYVSTSLPDAPFRRYASVIASSTSPSLRSNKSLRASTLGKSSTKSVPLKEFHLYRSQNVIGTDNDNERGTVYRTGATDHSVFYHVPGHPNHQKASLAEKINEVFPFRVGLGHTSSSDSSGTTIEISLIDPDACKKAISAPITINGQSFYTSPAVHPDQALLEVNLSKLPIWQLDKLCRSLLNNFFRYGVVREMSIYLDDWSGCWFIDNRHLYIERRNYATKQYETLTYKIDLEGGSTFCLGTWSKMEPIASTEVISEAENVDTPTVQVDAAFDTIVQVEVPEVLEIHEAFATSVPSHLLLLIPRLYKANQTI